MAFAQGSRSEIAIGVQADFDTAATTYTKLPVKTFTADLSKSELQGQDILADRMQRISRHGNRSVAGSLDVDLRMAAYDDLIESLMLSSFNTSNEIEIGTTPKFLTLEDRLTDIGQYRLFTGMAVNSASFTIAPDTMIETSFDMVGKDMSVSTSAKTASAASTNTPFDSYNAAVYEGGVATGNLSSVVASLSFTVTNSFAPLFVVGSAAAADLEYGRAAIEGTLSVRTADATFINKFLNETESAIQVSVDVPGGGESYTFYMPRVKYNGANLPLSNEQSRVLELPFRALYDSVEGTSLRITRST